uniref:OSJNBa0067G20.20 protein n=1 Tax=Oryza sativa subsp. japonica TaxID=39947 RepID=Q7XVS7_ORYSJ|nr:OSJNBa0067G20.20 [Oryza sativa Japonica Group]CAE04043.2 OSJNBb0062B06.1 [Oryza sativa Japonica Group]
MTTNLAEVYNWVMHGVRGLPLVGIVEFILHGTCRYFRDRFQAILPSMPNNSILFGTFMQKKLEELRKKAMKHRALVQGTQQQRFEILCQDKAGRGIYRKRVKQECVLKANGTCHCSCAKPKLLHRPCTHVIAAAAECGIPDAVYVSQYFSKQAIYHTWSSEIYGFGIAGEFTETNDEVLNIPDPSKLRGKARRRRTRRIRNDMDESDAGRVKHCSKCDERGHTYKHCPKDKEKPNAAEAGLSGSAVDGARPTDGTSGYTSVVGPGDRSPTPVSPYCGTGGSDWDVPGTDVRLREAGLLPMCRLVEAAAGDVDPARRWTVDRSLLAALVDRWRPETHTFHLPCGEVAPTLQDISYLLGLPLAGDAVRPVTTGVDWQDDLTARFALVQRAPHLPLEPLAHHRNTGPTKRWLLQFTVEQLQAEADEYSYSRCLEAYLLWLFGWVMFCGGHGHGYKSYRLSSMARRRGVEDPNWRSDPCVYLLPPWCQRPLCLCGDRCQLMASRNPDIRGRHFFRCPNYDRETRTTACAYIEWVDTENPVLDLTTCLQEGRWYFASESTEQYLQRKAAYERQCREQQSDWRVLTTALPPWEARPRCRCGDRCQVLRSIKPTTLGRRFFVCLNILDDDFMEPPRRCQYREWIDTRRVLTPPSHVVQLELPEQYRVTKARFERGEGSSRRG